VIHRNAGNYVPIDKASYHRRSTYHRQDVHLLQRQFYCCKVHRITALSLALPHTHTHTLLSPCISLNKHHSQECSNKSSILNELVHLYDIYTQGDSGGMVTILEGDSIGHCKKKNSSYEHVSNCDWLPR
jgi:hypothetical protein